MTDSRLPDWIAWMQDYVATANCFVEEEPIPVLSEDERKLLAIKMALYARALTLFQGALLLIENDRQLDFRVLSRGVIEAVMYLIALDRDPAWIEKMKDDDDKSRHVRAKLHLKAKVFDGSPEVRKMLDDFAAGPQKAKALQVASLLQGSPFDRLYRAYRDISGDATHVSLTSLDRHYMENPVDQSVILIVHPELDEVDFHITMSALSFSMMIATLLLMKIKKETKIWDKFDNLLRQYRLLADGSL